MKVGIIGVGMVGSALSFGFKRIGHTVLEHDPKLGTKIGYALQATIVFVCVPTPVGINGSCDTSAVADVVHDIAKHEYPGLVVIKSTVTPGTTAALQREHPQLCLTFCPEFLRERAAFSDFVENNDVCIVGTNSDHDYRMVCEVHGPLPKQFVRLTPTEAEMAKYFANTFNAMRVVFANQFYDVCQEVGVDYSAIKNAVTKRHNIGDHYLDCSENFRAFGGSCLPKDTLAFAAFVRSLGCDQPLFAFIVRANEAIKAGE